MISKIIRHIFCFLATFLLAFLSANLWAQTPSVHAKVDAINIKIGDQFHLFLEAQVPQGTGHLQWANIPAMQGLELVDTGRVDSIVEGKNTIYRQTLSLTGFDSGQFSVPQFEFKVKDPAGNINAVFTDSFVINVATIAVDTSAPIRPIKEIKAVEKDWWANWPYFLIGLLAVIILCFLIYFLIKRRKAMKAERNKIQDPPNVIALKRLAKMKQASYDGDEGQKLYYTELTDVMKDYIEANFAMHISEMTTDELLKMAKKNPNLKKIRTELKHILQTADLAKFAKAKPGVEEQDACMNAAVYIINKTKQTQQEGGVS